MKFNLESYDFFRIEGHQSKSSAVAEPLLTGSQTVHGLDFDFTSFDMDANPAELQQFINKNNSLEHLSGVPKGGTFVVLRKANLIVADFALSYKHRAEQAESCCKISECSYPWISSLKIPEQPVAQPERHTEPHTAHAKIVPAVHHAIHHQWHQPH